MLKTAQVQNRQSASTKGEWAQSPQPTEKLLTVDTCLEGEAVYPSCGPHVHKQYFAFIFFILILFVSYWICLV